MNVLAIIPARGGSKGIPRKNIRSVDGRPLISYMIEAALGAKTISRVAVSTDDSEIASVAKNCGAEIVIRPAQISGDNASSETALLHTLDHYVETENYQPDITVFLQCTSPLTISDDIDNTVQKMLSQNADTALAVAPFHYFVWTVNDSGEAIGVNHDKKVRLMRQQRQNQFVETGAVYAMKTAGFLKFKHRFFGKTVCHEMPIERCFEIDDPVDLDIVEAIMRSIRK